MTNKPQGVADHILSDTILTHVTARQKHLDDIRDYLKSEGLEGLSEDVTMRFLHSKPDVKIHDQRNTGASWSYAMGAPFDWAQRISNDNKAE